VYKQTGSVQIIHKILEDSGFKFFFRNLD